MRLEHPIFTTPLRPVIKLDKTSKWETGYDNRGTWHVQTGKPGKDVDYGVVSDGHGFEDSPDCERISGGVNSKGPYAVAIGRQANMLQWGFYAAPDRMTVSGKKVFLNAIVYMSQFDGRRPLVKKKGRGRGWYVQYVQSVRDLAEKDGKYRQSYSKYLKGQFPADVIADVGLDADALEKWRKANVEYFHAKKRYGLGVDEDLRKLGLSNRKPEFLDWIVTRFGDSSEDKLALRLSARYLGEHGCDAKTALAYIADNRKWLFFSDSGGYRWFVDKDAKKAAAATGTEEASGQKLR